MYLYFDKNYILKEQITDLKSFQSASQVNEILIYVEGLDTSTKDLAPTIMYRIDNDTYTNELVYNGVITQSLPLNRNQDLKFFQYGVQYNFLRFVIPDEVLASDGLKLATVRLVWNDRIQPLGLITFNVEKEVVKDDIDITQSQWNYLLKYLTQLNTFIRVYETLPTDLSSFKNGDVILTLDNYKYYEFKDGSFNEIKLESTADIPLIPAKSLNVADRTKVDLSISSLKGNYLRALSDDWDNDVKEFKFLFSNNSVSLTGTIGGTTFHGHYIFPLISASTEGTTDYGNICPLNISSNNGKTKYFVYRVNNAEKNIHEIRMRSFTIKGVSITISDYKVVYSSQYGVYEPFEVLTNDNNMYLYISEETDNKLLQNIIVLNVALTYDNNDFSIQVTQKTIAIKGSNQLNDNGDIVEYSRPGFNSIVKLVDGSYFMIFETNINNNINYPYVIQYCYSKDLLTWTTPKTLFKSKNYLVNIPYMAIDENGLVAIIYHTTDGFVGPDSVTGINRKIYRGFISNKSIKYNDELYATNFNELPIHENGYNGFSGGWGSVVYTTPSNGFVFLYAVGNNSVGNNVTVQTNWKLFTYAFDEKVDKIKGSLHSGKNVAYIQEDDGVDGFQEISSENKANTLVSRDANGRFEVNDPTSSLQAVNKQYAEKWFLFKNVTDGAYATVNGTQTKIPVTVDATASGTEPVTGNSIVRRSSGGFAYVTTPTNYNHSTNPNLVVTKNYVYNYLKLYLENNVYNTYAKKTDLDNYTLLTSFNEVKALIPNQASASNQLADKNFVNSSINSSAAYFIGSFATKEALDDWQTAHPTSATNNDYAYVEADETHNNEAWRYIYVKETSSSVGTWKAQFKVNDTPFTASQLASINSGVTSEKITSYDNHIASKSNPHGVTKAQVGLDKVDNTSDLEKPVSNATSTELEKKLDKVSSTSTHIQAYTKNTDGSQSTTNVSENVVGGSIAKRTSTGQLKAIKAVENDDLVNLNQMNGELEKKQDVINENNKLDYNYLKNTPTIPTKTSQLTNDSNYVVSSNVKNILKKTEEEYNNLTTKDSNTLYIITE